MHKVFLYKHSETSVYNALSEILNVLYLNPLNFIIIVATYNKYSHFSVTSSINYYYRRNTQQHMFKTYYILQ